MHLQIQSSPGTGHGPDEGRTPQERLLDRTAALRRAGVSLEGLAPELGGGHFRLVVHDKDVERALAALAPWSPIVRPAFTRALPNEAGELDRLLGRLAKDFRIESVVLLASRGTGGEVLVSVGLDRPMEWEDWSALGGWDDGEEHPGSTGKSRGSRGRRGSGDRVR
jgi:hypothetical protein